MAKPAKKPRPADTLRVKPYVERVKALMLEQKALGADVSDVCKEAKEVAGLDPTTLRFVAREALMDKDKRAERDSKREEYLHALDLAVAAVESGELSARQSAKLYSIGKTSLYKELGVRALSATREMEADDLGEWQPPHDPGTGEILAEEISLKAPPASILPSPGTWQGITAVREAHHAAVEAAREARRLEREQDRRRLSALAALTDADMPDPPPFLIRAKQERAA